MKTLKYQFIKNTTRVLISSYILFKNSYKLYLLNSIYVQCHAKVDVFCTQSMTLRCVSIVRLVGSQYTLTSIAVKR